MSKHRQAALMAAFLLAACGGGGGGGDAPPAPPSAITPAEALRTTAQAVMDVTTLAWALASDVQNTIVSAPSETVRTSSCDDGGRVVVTRPILRLLRTDFEACVNAGIAFGGRVDVEGAVVSVTAEGTAWSGTARLTSFSWMSGGTNPRSQTVSVLATGSGTVNSRGQPLTLQLDGLSASRSPSALGLGARLTSPLLRVERVPARSGPTRDLYALDGCVAFTASSVTAELCVDAGSRIGLLENVADEQLTGRLRWNTGSSGGFHTRLRITPAGAAGSTALRIELDLDNNGSYEAAATLDRVTDIGLRL